LVCCFIKFIKIRSLYNYDALLETVEHIFELDLIMFFQFLEEIIFLDLLANEIEHKSIKSKYKIDSSNTLNVRLAWRILKCSPIDYR
jgi:hypothetical protein